VKGLCHLEARKCFPGEKPIGRNGIRIRPGCLFRFEEGTARIEHTGGVRISYLKSPRSKNRTVKERISRHRKGSASKKNRKNG
jgi:hypothetical protein